MKEFALQHPIVLLLIVLAVCATVEIIYKRWRFGRETVLK